MNRWVVFIVGAFLLVTSCWVIGCDKHTTIRRCKYEIAGAIHDCKQPCCGSSHCGMFLRCVDGDFGCAVNVKEFGCYDEEVK